jgi:hypothetical protein
MPRTAPDGMQTPTTWPRDAKEAVDQQFARWVMLHVQSNPLPICTRPRLLIKGSAPDDGVRGSGAVAVAALRPWPVLMFPLQR